MTKECDNRSVGVIIEHKDKILLLLRAKFPKAFAPPAGHQDEHGSPEQTAIEEVREELGLIVAKQDLIATAIANRQMSNPCRRPGGDHHRWWVYKVTQFQGTLTPSQDETRGAAWYSRQELRALADRSRQFHDGVISSEQWEQKPGLEPVWLDFLTELGYLDRLA